MRDVRLDAGVGGTVLGIIGPAIVEGGRARAEEGVGLDVRDDEGKTLLFVDENELEREWA